MANAIVMASGLGTRMRPLTLTRPKPLIEVKGTPIIETILKALCAGGVNHIYVVVGYLKEQFAYLTKKYPNCTLIENPDYASVNNISSIYYALDVLLQGDCYICEADLYLSNQDLFVRLPNCSGYFGKFVAGFSDDWLFDTDKNGRITRVGKGGLDRFNMAGISYFTAKDAQIIASAVKDAYGRNGYEKLFWDDVVNEILSILNLRVFPVSLQDITEIDTLKDLMEINEM